MAGDPRNPFRAHVKHMSSYCQGAVRAALFGRVLVIDGVEKAERNLLPVLNNLLENREMRLQDGRFLMHHTRFDQLLEACLCVSPFICGTDGRV
jgi:hypothetical protein